MQLDEVPDAGLEGQSHSRQLSPERLAGAVASPALALEAAKHEDPAHWCLDRYHALPLPPCLCMHDGPPGWRGAICIIASEALQACGSLEPGMPLRMQIPFSASLLNARCASLIALALGAAAA